MENNDNLDEVINLYNWKNSFFQNNDYEEINIYQFLELVFDTSLDIDGGLPLPFEEVNCENYQKWQSTNKHPDGTPFVYNAIALVNTKEKKKSSRLLLQGDDLIDAYVLNNDFAISSPITYVGRRRTSENARFLYALAFDLDCVTEKHIRNLYHQMFRTHITPAANIIVNSGNGLHLYYLFKKPIPLYKENKKILLKLKRTLTWLIWNRYTSSLEDVQYQSFLQGFRLPGSLTKFGKKVRAFYNADIPRHTIEDLTNPRWFPEEKITRREILMLDGAYVRDPDTDLSLAEAKEKYPDWYDRVILHHNAERKTVVTNSAVYYWWMDIIKKHKIRVGHRFFACYALVCFAVKCGISKQQVTDDVLSLVPYFNVMSPTEDQFLESDARAALKAYKRENITVSRSTLAYMTGIKIPKNKRNGRTTKEHLIRARAVRDIYGPTKWMEGNGRKSKQKLILDWQKDNPSGTKADCVKALGISYSTLLRWWTSKESTQERIKKWKAAHPDCLKKSQCAKELDLSRNTVAKYWD